MLRWLTKRILVGPILVLPTILLLPLLLVVVLGRIAVSAGGGTALQTLAPFLLARKVSLFFEVSTLTLTVTMTVAALMPLTLIVLILVVMFAVLVELAIVVVRWRTMKVAATRWTAVMRQVARRRRPMESVSMVARRRTSVVEVAGARWRSTVMRRAVVEVTAVMVNRRTSILMVLKKKTATAKFRP